MSEPEVTHTPLSRLGAFLDWLKGESRTTMALGPPRTRYLTLETDDAEDYPKAMVICQRQVFHTRYRRWWIPNRRRTTYTVSISVDPALMERYGTTPFEMRVYPLLCNRLLEWTTYPHLCAIETFTDELYECLRTLKGEPTTSSGDFLA